MQAGAIATPAAAGRNEMLAFAQVELGGILVGIPAPCVVRALPRPARLAQVPRSSAVVDGVFSDGERVVPLIDLRRWMANGDASGEQPHVMVLDVDGCSAGLAVNAILGLVRVPADRIRRVHHDDAADEFFHSVASLDDEGTMISILDPARLMAQVQAWTQNQTAGAARDGTKVQAVRSQAALFALVRVAGSLVAVGANHAGEVVRNPQVQVLDLGDSGVAGILRRRGEQIPVLAAGALGIGGAAQDSKAVLMLLLYGAGLAVALPIDGVHSVESLDTSAVQPALDAGLAPGSFFTGVVRTADGESVLLLDSERVLSSYAVAGLSDGVEETTQLQRDGELADAHIVVQAGQEWAIPMGCVHEILPLPDDFNAVPVPGESVIGSTYWRGLSLPVLDLGGGGTSTRDRRSTRMVVVEHEARHAALLADELTALLPSNSATRSRFRLAGGELMDMLTVGPSGARKSYRIMELGALPWFAAA
jgi:chemotaxis signal transduction protein